MNERILCGDTDILLPQCINANIKVDLILTDVPYNVGVHFGAKLDKEPLDKFIDQNLRRFEMYKELLTDDGSIIMFVSNAFLHCFITSAVVVGLKYKMTMTWLHRNAGRDSKYKPKIVTDPIIWFTKGDTWTYNKDDIRIPYSQPERRKYGENRRLKDGTIKHYSCSELGAAHTNVWEVPALSGGVYAKERVGHKTQKPEELIIQLIKAFCKKDDSGHYSGTVFDPFLGSGTTGAACEKLNKEGHCIEWFGIEFDKHWCEVAESRIAKIIDNDK